MNLKRNNSFYEQIRQWFFLLQMILFILQVKDKWDSREIVCVCITHFNKCTYMWGNCVQKIKKQARLYKYECLTIWHLFFRVYPSDIIAEIVPIRRILTLSNQSVFIWPLFSANSTQNIKQSINVYSSLVKHVKTKRLSNHNIYIRLNTKKLLKLDTFL